MVDGTRTKSGSEWSLRSIFGSNIQQTCPLTSLTNVYVDLQVSKVNFNVMKIDVIKKMFVQYFRLVR